VRILEIYKKHGGQAKVAGNAGSPMRGR